MTKSKFILLILFCLITNFTTSQNNEAVQQKINYYLSQAKLDSAKTYIQTQLKNLDQNKKKSALNYELVKVFFMQSAYDEALEQAFNSLDTLDDETLRVKFNFMIGAVYSAISDYGKSVEYFDLVVKNSKDSSLSVKAHLLLSDLYLTLNDTINGKKSITEAYKIMNASKVDSKMKDHVSMQYNFIKKNYEICKELNYKTIKDSTSFLNSKSFAYSMIGDCLVEQDSLLKAATYYDELLKLTFETKDPEQIKDAANKLIDVYEKIGNQEKANTYHKIYNKATNDSLSFSVEKYRDLYDIEKNRELNNAKTRNLRNYLIYGSLVLLLMS